MLYLDLNGTPVPLPAGTTAQVEHKNTLFLDGLEDSFSLPFELPTRGNEKALAHVHELPLNSRTKVFRGARLGHQGVPLYPGLLRVLSTVPQSVRASFSLDGFVDLIKGITLPDALRNERIDMLTEYFHFEDIPDYAAGGPCHFPMFYNEELYGDANPDWFPSTSAWSGTQAYAQNDLVEYTEYQGGVIRTDKWQCTDAGGTTAGQSPETQPAKWRRAAYGIVNAWDRVGDNYHYNTTDGNFYTFVPWFYLKWVLTKALAAVDYTPTGEFMEDASKHQLALPNATTIDSESTTPDDYFFLASQTTPVNFSYTGTPPNLSTGWALFKVPGNLETPAPNQDPTNVWNNSTHVFTCAAVGTWRFRIRVTMSGRRSNITHFHVVRADGTIKNMSVYVEPLDIWIAGGGFQNYGNYTVEHQFSVAFNVAEVGDDFHFAVLQENNFAQQALDTTVNWPNNLYGTETLSNCLVSGWLEAAAPTVCIPSQFIYASRHVPNVLLGDFINAIAEEWNIDLQPDPATRTLRMDYKEQVLTQPERKTTTHSHRLVNDVEIDHQRAITGAQLEYDIETNEEDPELLASVTEYYSENDLPVPLTTGERAIVKSTRGLYKSIFKSGFFAWEQVGYHVPRVLVGEEENAIVVKPALKPLHMKQEQLDGKEYLIPVLNQLGTSAWFHTEGDRDTIWVCEIKRQKSSDGSVTNVPGARSWGYGWSSEDVSETTLLWMQDDADLPGVYNAHWKKWLAMLTTAEPVTLDLLVDTPFLKGTEWRRILHMHGQNYLVENMPVTYGSSEGQLMSRGAYAYRMRQGEVVVSPSTYVPQDRVHFIFSSDKSGAIELTVNTTGGYYTIRAEDGTTSTHTTGYTAFGPNPGGSKKTYEVWSSDADGHTLGEVSSIIISAQNILGFAGVSMPECTSIDINSNVGLISFDTIQLYALTSLAMTGCTALTSLSFLPMTALEYYDGGDTGILTYDLSNNPELIWFVCDNIAVTSVDLSNNPLMQLFSAYGCAITNTDQIINWFDPSIEFIYIELSGGTNAARTAASDTNYTAILSNGGSVNHN